MHFRMHSRLKCYYSTWIQTHGSNDYRSYSDGGDDNKVCDGTDNEGSDDDENELRHIAIDVFRLLSLSFFKLM